MEVDRGPSLAEYAKWRLLRTTNGQWPPDVLLPENAKPQTCGWRQRLKHCVALSAAHDITAAMTNAGPQSQTSGRGLDQALTRRRFIGHADRRRRDCFGRFAHRSFAAANPEARPAWRCRLSTSSILFKGLPLEEACARIAALGFEAVDIWSAYDNCPHLDDAATRLGRPA